MDRMTEEQREFWRSLTAPFPRDAYKIRDGAKGKKFTYLDSRTIENRLDDVVGPENWDLIQEETSRGVISRLALRVPGNDGNIVTVTRTGGGGFRQLQDNDSSYKSGFTSSFRSAAARFGIGRDLYGNGMPAYCADLHSGHASGMPSTGAGSGPPPRDSRTSSNGNGYSNSNGGDMKPPYGKTGKASYAWAKKASDHFQIDVLGRMIEYAKKRKKPERTDQWDEGFLDECLSKTVGWLKTLDNYNGEFGQADPKEPAIDNTPQPRQQAQEPGQIHSLVAPITAAVNALIHKQTGRDATPAEIVACIQELASSVPDGNGVRGQVMQSLRNCQDGAWLKRILDAVNKRIQEIAQTADDAPLDDDIPF